MPPAFRRCEVVLGKLSALMFRHAVVVWLGMRSSFLQPTCAAVTAALKSFKGVFGHYEEMPDLRR